ncbi:hypothetical protein BYT27DRAFT_6339853 [Phlegmacium glaucopus]|nr:hypothetical protein BYT27DRAFT_6339853 [Phlegmacium glaucopus]
MGPSSSFTWAITSSCVSAVDALRRVMFRTSSNRLCTPYMENSMLTSISLSSKTRWTASSNANQTPPGDGGDLIGNDKDQDDQDHNHGSGSRCGDSRRSRHGRRGVGKSGEFRGSAGRKGPTDDELVAIKNAIHLASNRDVVLLPPIQCI